MKRARISERKFREVLKQFAVDSQLFDKAIFLYFEEIAACLGARLNKVQDGVFEITAEKFALRLRLDTGHARGMNAILRKLTDEPFDENKPGSQLGALTIAGFEGADPKTFKILVDSDEAFLRQAELMANASSKFLLPYLLGLRDNFEDVQKYVREKGKQSIERIREYRFPKNVREEWI